jgi:hypothetical protein
MRDLCFLQRRSLALIAALAGLAGCAATTAPEYDARFGDGNRQLNAQQLIDPAAPVRNAANTPRTDGRTMRDAMDRLGFSFKEPPPNNVLSLGVIGGGGGGGNGR